MLFLASSIQQKTHTQYNGPLHELFKLFSSLFKQYETKSGGYKSWHEKALEKAFKERRKASTRQKFGKRKIFGT